VGRSFPLVWRFDLFGSLVLSYTDSLLIGPLFYLSCRRVVFFCVRVYCNVVSDFGLPTTFVSYCGSRLCGLPPFLNLLFASCWYAEVASFRVFLDGPLPLAPPSYVFRVYAKFFCILSPPGSSQTT